MRRNRIITFAVVVGVAVAAISFLSAARLSGDNGGAAAPPPKTSGNGKFTSVLHGFGTMDIDNGTGLLQMFPETFPQPCKVAKVYFKEGQEVKKHAPLVAFEAKLAQMKVAEARAGLAKANAALAGARAKLVQANEQDSKTVEGHGFLIAYQERMIKSKKAEYDSALTDWEEQHRKLKGIGGENDPVLLAAAKKLEAARFALDAEEKKLEGLKKVTPIISKAAEAKAGIDEAQAAVTLQQVQLDEAEHLVELMVLKAPADGRIVRSLVSEGMTFGAQSRLPALFFQPSGPLVIRAEIDQEFASRVVLGQDVQVEDEGNSRLKWVGKVVRVASCFMPKRSNGSIPEGLALNESRVLECLISVDGPADDTENRDSVLRVGQRVKVAIGHR